MVNRTETFNRDRILYLTFGTFPSAAAHSVNTIKMCEALAKSEYEVTLVADARKREKDIFEFYRIKYPFRIKRMKLFKIRFLGRILFLMKAYFFSKKNAPDVLYTRDIFNAFLAKISRLPFIYEIHEISDTSLRKIIFKSILSSYDLKSVVFISEKLKETLMSEMGNLFENIKQVVAHDGVDLEDFDFELSQAEMRRSLNLPENAFIAGYTGSLFEGRGLDIILKLGSALKDVTFVLVGGEGKYLKVLERKVNDLQLGNIITKGFVPHKMIPLYLSSYDILLMPYQTEVLHRQRKHDTALYMSPLKMFEYMAAGKPIVASSIPVLEEVLQNKVNALLVEPDDIDEWIESIRRLKEEKEIASQIGKQAKEDVKRYSWDMRVKKIVSNIFGSSPN